MAETFTPGPWLQSKNNPLFVYAVYECRGNEINRFELIIQNGNHETPPDELLANARLIAEAPELLEHLKDMVRRFEGCLITHGTDKEFAQSATAHARAAIQKAIGQ